MQVFPVFPIGFASNSYLVTADGKTAVAIDAAQPRILEQARLHGLEVKFVLLTHGHFDHMGGCAILQKFGAKVGCPEEEKEAALHHDLAKEFCEPPVPPFQIDFTYRGGETLTLCGLEIGVIATPGHTAGSCTFRIGNALFTGDTLFCGSVGRTDLPTGDGAALMESLYLLCSLGENFTVYAGHGEVTTLATEKKENPFLL